MTDTIENLLLDLIEWMDTKPRPYGEVLDSVANFMPSLARVRGGELTRLHGAPQWWGADHRRLSDWC